MVMLRSIRCLVPQYYATSPFSLLCNGQGSDCFLLHTEYAEQDLLSVSDLNILLEVSLSSVLGNMVFSEIQNILSCGLPNGAYFLFFLKKPPRRCLNYSRYLSAF